MNDDFVPAHPQDPGLDPAADAAGHAEAILKVEDVSKIYRSGDTEVHAVSSATMAVDQGEFVALLGPSGCGKTTSLRVMAGFERPTSGSVWLEGRDITALRPYDRPVNTVFQDYALFPHMSVLDNVAYGLRVRRVPRREREARAHEMLATVQLEGMGKRVPGDAVQTTNGRTSTGASAGQRDFTKAASAAAVANLPPSGPTPTKSVSQKVHTAFARGASVSAWPWRAR